MNTILVTGATGNVGAHVVRALQTRGASVRAFVRDADAAAAKLGGVELAVGDFADPLSLQYAMVGVDRVFLTSADGPNKVAHETAVIDAAAVAGVQQIVKLSTIGAQIGSPLPGANWHGQIEHHLAQSGVPATVLQSTFFMTNLLMMAEHVRSTGQLSVPTNNGRVAMIDPRDIGAVAATTLTTAGHTGHTYLLTGEEAISFAQIAQALSEATGRTVTFANLPEEIAPIALAGAGPEWLVTQLLGVFALIRQGAMAQTSPHVRMLTGHDPRAIADFAHDYARAFGG